MSSYQLLKIFHIDASDGPNVCKEWHTFMDFHAWIQSLELEKNGIDEDELMKRTLNISLLQFSKKKEDWIYSPETCLFVPRVIDRLLSVDTISKERPKKLNLAIGRFGCMNL